MAMVKRLQKFSILVNNPTIKYIFRMLILAPNRIDWCILLVTNMRDSKYFLNKGAYLDDYKIASMRKMYEVLQ